MKHGCVVLADIHHPMLEATRGLLDTKFRTVVMVSSCESLLEATIKIRPDLIVADLSLPSSDGHKLLLKSDNRLEEFNMIVLGTYNERGIVENIMKTGANGYVLKGAAATDLLLAVDIVMGGDNYVFPLVSSG
jgi:DNA-binding NarL/FixJ family response regulator